MRSVIPAPEIGTLYTLNQYFGMPQQILPTFSFTALSFFIYSLSCNLARPNNPHKFLLPVIIANLTYCMPTLSLVIYFWPNLPFLGITYFVGEILIVTALVSIELKTLNPTLPQ